MTSQRKLYMVGICSTVEKRAKRMPDIIVETAPLLPLFSPDLANKACPFALHACRHEAKRRACNKGKATRACCMFELSHSSSKKEGVEYYKSLKVH